MTRHVTRPAWLAGFAAVLVAMPASLTAQADAAEAADSADAVSGFQSAGDLLRKCRENSSHARSYCFAYLAAAADTARAYRAWLGSADPCLPASITLGRLADVFDAYLVANPSLTEAQAASVIVASLQDAFPCQVGEPTTVPPGH